MASTDCQVADGKGNTMTASITSARRAARLWARAQRGPSTWLSGCAADHNAAFYFGPGLTLQSGELVDLHPGYGVLSAVTRADEPFIAALLDILSGKALGKGCTAISPESVPTVHLQYDRRGSVQLTARSAHYGAFTQRIPYRQFAYCEEHVIPISLLVLGHVYRAIDAIDIAGTYRQHNALERPTALSSKDYGHEDVICTACEVCPVFRRLIIC